ncbi:cubilin-like, partial [Diaphorina citri]|uniref:Cubilin-like n=1 Tax=Diaphorina citri TaxID=121845 RepID=A0A1S3DPG8_DIACI
INDGEMVYSPVLLKVCQSGRNLSPVTTSGSEALVWPSDLPDVKGNTRLQITYRPVPACGGTIVRSNGTLHNSLNGYNTRSVQSCIWTLDSGVVDRVLTISFSKFTVYSKRGDCIDNYLELRDAEFPTDASSHLGRFCSPHALPPSNVTSYSSKVIVTYMSSVKNNEIFDEWQLQWTSSKS